MQVMDIYRTPYTCSMFDEWPQVKLVCRWRKKANRIHMKIGWVATALFHVALATGWRRPTVSWKIKKPCRFTINVRKIHMWFHVITAYLAKGISGKSSISKMTLWRNVLLKLKPFPFWNSRLRVRVLSLIICAINLHRNSHPDYRLWRNFHPILPDRNYHPMFRR